MFYIDAFNKEEVSFENAVNLVKGRNRDKSLLENMQDLQELLASCLNDEDFCDRWCYEINAYNKVYAEMNKLFQ